MSRISRTYGASTFYLRDAGRRGGSRLWFNARCGDRVPRLSGATSHGRLQSLVQCQILRACRRSLSLEAVDLCAPLA